MWPFGMYDAPGATTLLKAWLPLLLTVYLRMTALSRRYCCSRVVQPQTAVSNADLRDNSQSFGQGSAALGGTWETASKLYSATPLGVPGS